LTIPLKRSPRIIRLLNTPSPSSTPSWTFWEPNKRNLDVWGTHLQLISLVVNW
jgi:hypothetical protein